MQRNRFTDLVTKEFTSQLSPGEANELLSLLQDQDLKADYLVLKEYLSREQYNRSYDEKILSIVKSKISSQEPVSVSRAVKKQKHLYWKAAAVIAFIVTSIAAYVLVDLNTSSECLTYAKKAEKTSLTLSDGTKVILNAGSKLSYPEKFNGDIREVTLSGEAFFDVTKDPGHPFIIHTGKMDIKVLGTSFNVKSYPDDQFSETTLIEGRVEVTLKDKPLDIITLKPSEKLLVENHLDAGRSKGSAITRIENVIPEITRLRKQDTIVLETSWLQNRIAFRRKNFFEISKILERAYDVQIRFRNEELKKLQFTGTFETESVADILYTLKMMEPFSFEMLDNKIIIQ